jgi:hypothetical protein
VIIKGYTGATGTNGSAFMSFINQDEGHVIINLGLETNGGTNASNRGFINDIYIAPPGGLDATNSGVTGYYDNTNPAILTVPTPPNVTGKLIDVDLQTQLLFRIVTRDPDTSGILNPINVY